MVNNYYTYRQQLICESFDDTKKSTDFTPEQKEVLDKIKSIVDKNYTDFVCITWNWLP